MTKQIAIMVEGATEQALKPVLLKYLTSRLPGQMPRLKFISKDGRLPVGDKLKRDVTRLLADGHDAVIALTDVYTGTMPPDFKDASDAKQKMRDWVGSEARFHPHAAQHDFEAWLLPYWARIQKRVGVDRSTPFPDPEAVNHGHPPSKQLDVLFRTGSKSKRRYNKVLDATAILRDQDLKIAAAQCPELDAFLATILTIATSP